MTQPARVHADEGAARADTYPAIARNMDLTRAALAVTRLPSAIQPKLDCAALAMEAGHQHAARALAQLAAIRSGFALSVDVDRRFGLAATDRSAEPHGSGGSTLAIAEAELTSFTADPRLSVSPVEEGWTLIEGALPLLDRWTANARHDRLGQAAATTPVPALETLVTWCDSLHRLLVARWSPTVKGELEPFLKKLAVAVADVPPFDVMEAQTGQDRLLAAVLSADLRHFLLAQRPLAFGPVGSAGTLHAAARLRPDGLGPYLGRMPQLARTGRDVPAMLQRACGRVLDEAELARWLPLLAAHLDDWQRETLLDELADRGLLHPLHVFAAIAIARSFGWHDRHIIWRVRDAALDLRAYTLAVAMQDVIVRWAAHDANEWRILADIHISAGDKETAERILRQGAAAAGPTATMRQRRAAIASGDLTEATLACGFSSNVVRAARRRDALAARSGHLPER